MAIDKIQIKLGENILDIEGVYIPLHKGIHTYPNGDPGYPDDPSEFAIDKVLFNNVDISDILNEIDTFFYLQLQIKESHRSIWDLLSEKALEEFEKILE